MSIRIIYDFSKSTKDSLSLTMGTDIVSDSYLFLKGDIGVYGRRT
ncbi:hypothetical protein [Leptospira bouyouniensis]|nr:hypothetical protein [Leptospira bouyouniensis]